MTVGSFGYGAAVVALVAVVAAAEAENGASGPPGEAQSGTAAGAQESPMADVASRKEHVIDATGTIVRLSPTAEWYVIVPDDDTSTRFAPSSLPDRFKEDGLRVVFCGRVGEIPPDVRLIGIPLELGRIEAIESSESK